MFIKKKRKKEITGGDKLKTPPRHAALKANLGGLLSFSWITYK